MDDLAIDTLAVRAGIERSQFNEHSEALYLTSSFVFSSAAEAAAVSMWTSSRMYTFVRPGEPTAARAMRSRMASTPLLEAASSSNRS